MLVDGGTVGAGGAFGVGEEPSGFALVHLDADDRARAVDLIEVEPERARRARTGRAATRGPPTSRRGRRP